MGLLFGGEFPPPGNCVPLFQAALAAGGGGVLGNEDGVTPKRGLLAVPGWGRRGKAGANELGRMAEHHLHAPVEQVFAFLVAKTKAAPKGRARQPAENVIKLSHPGKYHREATLKEAGCNVLVIPNGTPGAGRTAPAAADLGGYATV